MTYLIFWFLFAVITATVADRKGRVVRNWVIYALLLGPIALLHVLVAAPDQRAVEAAAIRSGDQRKCPACAEIVKREAIICRHCRSELPPLPADPSPAAAGTVAARPPAPGEGRRVVLVIAAAATALLTISYLTGRKPGASRGPSRDDLFIACTDRGLAYYKNIGSFPTLSDGRNARDVVFDKCTSTLDAF